MSRPWTAKADLWRRFLELGEFELGPTKTAVISDAVAVVDVVADLGQELPCYVQLHALGSDGYVDQGGVEMKEPGWEMDEDAHVIQAGERELWFVADSSMACFSVLVRTEPGGELVVTAMRRAAQ